MKQAERLFVTLDATSVNVGMVPTVLAFAVLFSSVSHAYVLKLDSSGSAIRWTRPVIFVVDSGLNQALGEPQATAAISAALGSWAVAAPTLPMSLAVGEVQGMGYDQSEPSKNRNEIYGVRQWMFDDNAIAVTLLTTDTSSHEILDADIALNLKSHTFHVLPVAHSDNHFDDIQNIVTHELGHALGLAHNPNDSSVVMYPWARLGETSKRLLSLDDEDGIAMLYPPGGPRSSRVHGGCDASATTSASAWPAFLLAALLWLRRRQLATYLVGRAHRARGVFLALFLLHTAARAFENERAAAPAKEAAVVATGEVLSTRLHPESKGGQLLITEVELSVRSCLKGSCPPRIVVMVTGGRFGKIEQFIEGEPVPERGSFLGVTLAPGTSPQLAPPGESRVYRLSLARDFAAFARGLEAAGLNSTLSRRE